MYQHDGTYPNTVVVPIHARGEIRRYIMGAIINKRIMEFCCENSLNVEAQYGGDRKCREAKYYTIFTENCIVMVSISPNCTYEQFLEKIASCAISEARELCDDYITLKKEATNGN